VVTLLDYLPSLGRAAAQRVDAAEWPRTAAIDELGRLSVGGVALADVADEFGTPAHVLDEADFRHRLHRSRAAARGLVPIVAGTSLPTTVMRWVDDEGLGLVLRGVTEVAAARAAEVTRARLVLHACGLHHDELTACAQLAPGRLVVDSALDVAYLSGVAACGQRMLVRAVGSEPDPATLDRVMRNPDLELVGLHRRVTDAVDLGIRELVASMADVRRCRGVLLTEISLTVAGLASGEDGSLAARVDDDLDEACAAFRFPRPRVVVETDCPRMILATVSVYRVTAVVAPACGPRVVVVDGRLGGPVPGSVVLANRHPLSADEPMTVCSADTEIATGVTLPNDVHPGDVLAVSSGTAGAGTVIAARDGLAHSVIQCSSVDEELRRDVGFSSRSRRHHQHRGG
jgi:diaminopimelate decarboxylase